MKAAITQHQIATEQYSQNHRNAIDHALNRRLVMDHQRYLRQPYAIASCDLKSCYDRINHSSAGLALRKIGISQQEIMSMFTTIQQMTHKVRTAFRDSVKSYGGQQTYKKMAPSPTGSVTRKWLRTSNLVDPKFQFISYASRQRPSEQVYLISLETGPGAGRFCICGRH